MIFTLSELAALVGGTVEGDGTLKLSGVRGLEDAQTSHLSFFSNPKYRHPFLATKAGAVLVPLETPAVTHTALIRVANPTLAFARISQKFHPRAPRAPGVHPSAVVDGSARIDASATLLAHVSVGANAAIGARVVLHPGVRIGDGARVGEDSELHANAVVEAGCEVGARCILHSNSVVGADGFGFTLDASVPEHVKIPQAGIARLEDDVELGAGSCVDRATHGVTLVGRGAKIDNLVQVGHNVTVGPLSILCAQVGIAGSTVLGKGVMLGGQAGLAGHIEIGDLTQIGAQSGVGTNIAPNQVLLGTPPIEFAEQLKVMISLQHLPQLIKDVRALRKRVAELEAAAKGTTP